MAKHRFDTEKAKEAGRKSKRGKDSKTESLRVFMHELTTDGADKAREELNKLQGKEYLDIFLKMMQYSLPTLKAVEMSNNIKGTITVDIPEDDD